MSSIKKTDKQTTTKKLELAKETVRHLHVRTSIATGGTITMSKAACSATICQPK